MNRPVLIFDGLNCFYRHYVANPSMSTNGDPVGGVVGFLKGINLLCERYNPAAVYVTWEGGGSVRRRSIDKNYKKGRRPEKLNRFYAEIPDTVSNRNDQVSKLVSLLRHAGIPQIYVSNCEADDIIAQLVRSRFKNDECIIISSDRDFFQLINSRIRVWSPGSKKEWTINLVLEKYGIHPENFCAARCFIGDGSDGLKGASGVGFKSLSKRLSELQSPTCVSVEDIVMKCRDLREQKHLKLYDSVIANEEVAQKNWKLMHLGMGNLSGTQVQKINGALEMDALPRNKLDFIRALMHLGIQSFDYDKLFMALRAMN
jgi:DNA polymerase-1